jgi:hypothetical protein
MQLLVFDADKHKQVADHMAACSADSALGHGQPRRRARRHGQHGEDRMRERQWAERDSACQLDSYVSSVVGEKRKQVWALASASRTSQSARGLRFHGDA